MWGIRPRPRLDQKSLGENRYMPKFKLDPDIVVRFFPPTHITSYSARGLIPALLSSADLNYSSGSTSSIANVVYGVPDSMKLEQ